MGFTSEQVRAALSAHLQDSTTLHAVLAELNNTQPSTPTAELSGAAIDLDRYRRCGFPEVIYAEGKPADLVVQILKRQQQAGQAGFATRVSPEQAEAVLADFPKARHNPVAKTLCVPTTPADHKLGDAAAVAVVSAGSCDAPVAQEAVETLRWMKVPTTFIEDVGVAGPQRLQKHVPTLQQMKVIVCVAGMEAALPSVLGGYVGCPVIGVPTSVGYGASLEGVTAMLSMLTCCASNVVTVNIDAGFRGGYVAGMIAKSATSSDKNG